LLLGSVKYGPAVDMWLVGCIFAELLNGKPILPAKNVVYFGSLHILAFGFMASSILPPPNLLFLLSKFSSHG